MRTGIWGAVLCVALTLLFSCVSVFTAK
jgi:hypothetical protein